MALNRYVLTANVTLPAGTASAVGMGGTVTYTHDATHYGAGAGRLAGPRSAS